MRDVAAIVARARYLAGMLENDMHWRPGDQGGGWWEANSPQERNLILARAATGLDFMRRYVGPESQFTRHAQIAFDNSGDRQSRETGARSVGLYLSEWADQVEVGGAEIHGSGAWAETNVASGDLMGHVQVLNADKNAHPAAAIVLCGAALEIALRATAEVLDLQVKGQGISAYTSALRQAGHITKQTEKELTSCAGLRNSAAHGDFDDLNRQRAGLMEQQTTLLLRTLTDLQTAH